MMVVMMMGDDGDVDDDGDDDGDYDNGGDYDEHHHKHHHHRPSPQSLPNHRSHGHQIHPGGGFPTQFEFKINASG